MLSSSLGGRAPSWGVRVKGTAESTWRLAGALLSAEWRAAASVWHPLPLRHPSCRPWVPWRPCEWPRAPRARLDLRLPHFPVTRSGERQGAHLQRGTPDLPEAGDLSRQVQGGVGVLCLCHVRWVHQSRSNCGVNTGGGVMTGVPRVQVRKPRHREFMTRKYSRGQDTYREEAGNPHGDRSLGAWGNPSTRPRAWEVDPSTGSLSGELCQASPLQPPPPVTPGGLAPQCLGVGTIYS